MIESVLRMEGLKGLVLETFGSGNAPEDDKLLQVLREGVLNGIVIVAVTQCMIGSVNPLYAAGTALLKTGVVFGLDMTTEAALTKLSCLLADPHLTPEEIRRTMSTSTRGELTESANTSFSHPESLIVPPKYSTLATIGYAISSNDIPAVIEILNISKDFLLNEFDHTGNTPIHLAAAAPNPEFLRLFLKRGGSVHLRNREGKTPLFIAAESGLIESVKVLREAGGHLHEDEKIVARGIRRMCEQGQQLGVDSLKDLNGDGLEAWLGGGNLQKERPYTGSPGRFSPGVKVRAQCWELAGAEA
jgi:60kDa lysophospholipase